MADTDTSTETAWQIYNAQLAWIDKVDNKATFALGVDSAALAVLLALSQTKVLSQKFLESPLSMIGAALLVLALLIAVAAVVPRIEIPRKQTLSTKDFVYFGHLRHWEPQAVEAAIATDAVLPQLARGMVVLARIAWWKHVFVAVSLYATIGAVLALALSAAWSR